MRRLASIRLDGELSEIGDQRLGRLLADCSPCREFATSIAATRAAVRLGKPREHAARWDSFDILDFAGVLGHRSHAQPDLKPSA